MTTTDDTEPYFVGHEAHSSTYPTHVSEVVEGDPSALRAAALRYSDTATALETLASDVRAAANRSRDVWDGDTAPVARAAVRDTSARIHALVQPLRDVAAAHTTLADKLEIYQGRVEDYWDSAKKNHLPQYPGAQWMSGAEEQNIRDLPFAVGDPDGKLQQDVADVTWLRSEIEAIKKSAAGGRRDFYATLISAQAACDVIDPTWGLVEEAPALVAPPAPAPVAPAPPLPAPGDDDAPRVDGGGGGGGGGGRGIPSAPSLPPLDVTTTPEIGEMPETVPVPASPESPEIAVGPESVAAPAVAPVAPEPVSPVPPAAWAAEQVAVRESLGAAPWTIQDDAGWSELVRADVGLQGDLAARNAEVAADAVRRFLETGATEGTFDVVSGEPGPELAGSAGGGEAGVPTAPSAPTLADRLGGLPVNAATEAVGTDAAASDRGLLHHHGSTSVARMDDGTFSVTLDVAYEWSDQIAPGATFAPGSWQDGAAGILTGGDAPYDLSVAWGGSATVTLDTQGLVLGTTSAEPR